MKESSFREQLASLVRQVDSEFKKELEEVEDKLFNSTDAIPFMIGGKSTGIGQTENWGIDEDAISRYPEEVQKRFRQLFNELIITYKANP